MGELAEYRAGQFLTVRLPTMNSQTITRCWSLSSYNEGGSDYRITVRRASGGRGSTHLHDSVRAGHVLEIKSPAGEFTLDRSTVFRVTLISAGIGVTPLLSMLKAHANREDPSPLLWIHITRNGATHVLRAEAEEILRANPQFRSHIVYTAPSSADRRGIDYHDSGRLDPERYAGLLGATYQCRPFGREIELPAQAGAFYICGPEVFEQSVRAALINFGVDPEGIHSESFGRNGADDQPTVEQCQVRFKRSSKTVLWRKDMDISLLELAEQEGLNPPSSCRAGSCHTCETSIFAGEVSYQIKPVKLPSEGAALICCARPNSEALEIDL